MADSLDKLTIRGFKSIRNLEDFPLTNLNVFIGANGAGKSNLLEFFRLLRNIIDGNLNDYIRTGGRMNAFLFNGIKTTPEMTFEMHFGLRGYRFTLEPDVLDNALLVREARYYAGGKSGWWELGSSPDGSSLLVQEAKSTSPDSRYSKPVYRTISSWQVYHFHDTSASAAMRRYEIIQEGEGRLRFNASNLAPLLLLLRSEHPDAYQEILNAVRLVMPFFDDFRLDVTKDGAARNVNLSWQQRGSDYPMQPYHLSDGSIRFICLATALLQPDPPETIIIDEPELGLHPFAIAILAELIKSAAKRTQVIVATQSPAFIDQFSIEDVVVVNRKDGASTFERLDEDDFNEWLETYSVGELWTKNVLSGGPVHE
jgi:predicted ATPase